MASVQVRDDLLTEPLKGHLIEAMSWMPVHFLNRRDRFDTHALDVHWYYPIAFSDEGDRGDVEAQLDRLEEQLACVRECWWAIKASFDRPVRLYECTLSANTFGTEGTAHHDVTVVEARYRHRTALVFCNARWHIDWAGETLVFGEDEAIVAAITPRPGRVLKIAGDPLHVGRSVSRICPTDRRVLVFKMWEADE